MDQLELTMHEVVSYHTKVSIYKLEKVCMCVASFETFGSGSFGGPLGVRWVLVVLRWSSGGPVGFGDPARGRRRRPAGAPRTSPLSGWSPADVAAGRPEPH